jgi:hypothetical protein
MPVDPSGPDTQVVGRYANSFHVGHNAAEFVLDFGQYFPADAAEQMHTRIVTNPAYAKALLGVLAESIATYERTFGTISAAE